MWFTSVSPFGDVLEVFLYRAVKCLSLFGAMIDYKLQEHRVTGVTSTVRCLVILLCSVVVLCDLAMMVRIVQCYSEGACSKNL